MALMTLSYKNLRVLRGMLDHAWHPTLISLYLWILNKYNIQVVVTCAFEKRRNFSVHNSTPLRGLDIRSRTFLNPETIEDEINTYWVYDTARPNKKVAIYHDTGRGRHIHLQVHDATRYLPSGSLLTEQE